ncbi:unnamed protein product [Medioppia subpectinata]|uniref:Transmembrane protein 256 homolog n=1 Tax=Medioppia subpectinata TaxID=1979941 RepID=A0A7R9Q174_9ACAR|nr:unnamed protein product [Medioppia subpectinata]CAG2108923.1 unnamed protein product [Medioppia subpectinata]
MDPNVAVIVGSVWVRLAGVYGALAVALGAYGAHVIANKKDMSAHTKDVYERANKYHILHALALLAVPLTAHPCLSGTIITIGMTLFCGTCYIHVFTGSKSIIRLTPVGGITLMIGWLTMAYV